MVQLISDSTAGLAACVLRMHLSPQVVYTAQVDLNLAFAGEFQVRGCVELLAHAGFLQLPATIVYKHLRSRCRTIITNNHGMKRTTVIWY